MAIQQHPVPQDISNYKFRLIGDMTIKQFASLGISIVLSVIIYSSPIPFFFKYPLSFLFLVLGVGMAFVPVQGRTLDVWIIAFIKSIYSPTQYIWKHGQDQQNISPSQPPISTESVTPVTPIVNITPPAAEEVLDIPNIPTESPKEPVVEVSSQPPISTKSVAPVTPLVNSTPSTENLTPITTSTSASTTETVSTSLETPTTNSTVTTITEPKKEEVVVPETIPTEIQKERTETSSTINISPPATTSEVQDLPIPFTPSTVNTLVGLTLKPDGHILEGVMVEIKQQDLTLRATKSNKLGQFLFARPLENGLYQIIAEKEGFSFEVYSIDLVGEIMNPLKIQATK